MSHSKRVLLSKKSENGKAATAVHHIKATEAIIKMINTERTRSIIRRAAGMIERGTETVTVIEEAIETVREIDLKHHLIIRTEARTMISDVIIVRAIRRTTAQQKLGISLMRIAGTITERKAVLKVVQGLSQDQNREQDHAHTVDPTVTHLREVIETLGQQKEVLELEKATGIGDPWSEREKEKVKMFEEDSSRSLDVRILRLLDRCSRL